MPRFIEVFRDFEENSQYPVTINTDHIVSVEADGEFPQEMAFIEMDTMVEGGHTHVSAFHVNASYTSICEALRSIQDFVSIPTTAPDVKNIHAVKES